MIRTYSRWLFCHHCCRSFPNGWQVKSEDHQACYYEDCNEPLEEPFWSWNELTLIFPDLPAEPSLNTRYLVEITKEY